MSLQTRNNAEYRFKIKRLILAVRASYKRFMKKLKSKGWSDKVNHRINELMCLEVNLLSLCKLD